MIATSMPRARAVSTAGPSLPATTSTESRREALRGGQLQHVRLRSADVSLGDHVCDAHALTIRRRRANPAASGRRSTDLQPPNRIAPAAHERPQSP